jgi:ParB family chromosome partitioning protein
VNAKSLKSKYEGQKKSYGTRLGRHFSAESKATINSATDEGADKFVGNIVEVALEDIYPNPTQPRTYFDEKALNELAQSIKNLGVIQPITLRKDGEKFEIISGERRYRASKIAGLTTIPAYIRLVNDQELLEMALVENIREKIWMRLKLPLLITDFWKKLVLLRKILARE